MNMIGPSPTSLTTTYTPVTPGNTQWNPWIIPFEGSLTQQQHKLGQYVVVNVSATLLYCNWPFLGSYQILKQASTSLNKGLKENQFTLETIIGSPTGTMTMQFRAGLGTKNPLHRIVQAVADQSLAKLILDYMIPNDAERKCFQLVLELDPHQVKQIENDLQLIQSYSEAIFQIYLASQNVAAKEQPNVNLYFYGPELQNLSMTTLAPTFMQPAYVQSGYSVHFKNCYMF